MRLILIIVYFSFTSALGVELSTSEFCKQSGMAIGESQVPQQCIEFVKDKGKHFERGVKRLYGLGSILVIENGDKQNIISGPASRLSEVVEVALGPSSKRVIVIDRSGEVLTYSADDSGDIAPRLFYKLPVPLIENFLAVIPLPRLSIMLFIDRVGEFYVYNIDATLHSPNVSHDPKLIRKFTSLETGLDQIESATYDYAKMELKVSSHNGEVRFNFTKYPILTRK